MRSQYNVTLCQNSMVMCLSLCRDLFQAARLHRHCSKSKPLELVGLSVLLEDISEGQIFIVIILLVEIIVLTVQLLVSGIKKIPEVKPCFSCKRYFKSAFLHDLYNCNLSTFAHTLGIPIYSTVSFLKHVSIQIFRTTAMENPWIPGDT